jgi:hypothetical protein
MQSKKGVQPELHGQSAGGGLQLDFGAQWATGRRAVRAGGFADRAIIATLSAARSAPCPWLLDRQCRAPQTGARGSGWPEDQGRTARAPDKIIGQGVSRASGKLEHAPQTILGPELSNIRARLCPISHPMDAKDWLLAGAMFLLGLVLWALQS